MSNSGNVDASVKFYLIHDNLDAVIERLNLHSIDDLLHGLDPKIAEPLSAVLDKGTAAMNKKDEGEKAMRWFGYMQNQAMEFAHKASDSGDAEAFADLLLVRDHLIRVINRLQHSVADVMLMKLDSKIAKLDKPNGLDAKTSEDISDTLDKGIKALNENKIEDAKKDFEDVKNKLEANVVDGTCLLHRIWQSWSRCLRILRM